MSADPRALDDKDPLRRFRSAFSLPAGVIYMDGNSLGALPQRVVERLTDLVARQWGQGLVRSWSACDWMNAPRRVGAKIARLIGAEEHEVVVTDSTSVNLFKLVTAALVAQPERKVVISEPGNFPTDLYAIEAVIRTLNRGHELRLYPRGEIHDAIDEDTALVLLTQVHYKTGDMLGMKTVTTWAHDKGALILWDLCHSAGAVHLDLNAAGADLAVGCGYKYLNGGPGAPSFLFVADRHQKALRSPLHGWLGHARPFDFLDTYEPAEGIGRFLCGTPSILGMTALEAGVDLLLEVDMAQVAEKSQALAALFIEMTEACCDRHGLKLAGPRKGRPRGSHVAFEHPHALAIVQKLIELNVIGDFRDPNIMRFGLTPLYLSYEDVATAARTLEHVLDTCSWDAPRYRARGATT